jgi:type VI secretion system protein ImpB
MKDFRPEAIARQVPAVKNLLELRDAMKALRPIMGDKKKQKKLLEAIKDPAVRDQIVGMIASGEAAPAPEAAAEAAPPADDGGGAPAGDDTPATG